MPPAAEDIPRLQALFLQGDAAALAAALESCPAPPPRCGVAAMVRHALAAEGDAAALGLPPLDAALMRVAADRSGTDVPPPSRIGPELDLIGQPDAPSVWTAARWLAFLRLHPIPPSRRAAVVVTMRDDGLSALEWIAHYRVLGFEHIFVYSNDNADGSEALLRRLAAHGVITFIENVIGPDCHPQRKAFAHALFLLPALRAYEWVFFLDSDEFFIPPPDLQPEIGAVLDRVAQRFPDHPPAAICYNWRWYVGGWRYAWAPGLLLNRFRHAIDDMLLKSLVRLSAVTSMVRLHGPLVVPGEHLALSDLSLLDPDEIFSLPRPVYEGGQLNHYWVKSFEEFSIKKARGDALSLERNDYARGFVDFFSRNERETPENFLPPPPLLVARVRAEMDRLRALPGIARHLRDIRDRLPAMLARFDSAGGLAHLYTASRSLPPASSGT